MDDTFDYFDKHPENFWTGDRLPHNTFTAFKKTLEKCALIASGEEIVAGEAHSCGLCNYFSRLYPFDRTAVCDPCPIYKDTKQHHCKGTPYPDVIQALVHGSKAEHAWCVLLEIIYLLRICRIYNTECGHCARQRALEVAHGH